MLILITKVGKGIKPIHTGNLQLRAYFNSNVN
jgi:hypothetical protein